MLQQRFKNILFWILNHLSQTEKPTSQELRTYNEEMKTWRPPTIYLLQLPPCSTCGVDIVETSKGVYSCPNCKNASQSHQNEAQVLQHLQQQLDAVQQKRVSSTIHNRQANEGIMQYIGTEILTTGPLTPQEINAFTHQDIAQQDTELHEVIVMKKGQPSCNPFLVEGFDPEKTQRYKSVRLVNIAS